MSPAKIVQMMTGMVCQRSRGEFAGEVGCGPKKLVGAPKKRWGREAKPPFDAAWIDVGNRQRGNIEQRIPHARREAMFHVDFPCFQRVNYCSQKRELL